jgi:single-strand DNA-binding protein
MSKDLNIVTLIGNLTRDPEIKYTAGGTAVTKFSIANNETYLQNNEKKEYVNYFDIIVWGNHAINCEKFLKKGSKVAVSGALRQERWTDNASGQVKSKVSVTANSVQFLSQPSGQTPAKQNADNVNQSFNEDPWGDAGNPPSNDGDIPF